MQISLLSAEGLKQEYKVIVPATDVNKTVEDRLKVIGKTVKIPGFRPGMIPTSVLKQRYGKDATEEALKKIVQNGVNQIIKDKALKIVTMPQISIESVDEGKDLEYNAVFELLPDFEIMDFKKIGLETLDITITEEQLDKHLNEVHQNHKVFVPLEKNRPSKEGDFLHVDIEATIDGAPFKGIAPHYQTVVGNDDSVLSGEFEKHLVGKKIDQPFEVKEIFPENFKVSNLSNKEVIISAKITKIEEPKIFKLDDDFAKEFQCDTLEIFKDRLRSELQRQGEILEKTRLKRFLLDNLQEQYTFSLPETLVETEFQAIWKRLQEELEAARAEGSLEQDDDRSEEDLKNEYKVISQRRVRLGLIITEVAKLNNIRITNADVNQALAAEAAKYPNQVNEVYDYYKKNRRALEALMAPIMEDKVVDYILSQVTLSKRKVDLDAFMKEIRGVIPGFENDEEDELEADKGGEKSTSEAKVSKGKVSKKVDSKDNLSEESSSETNKKKSLK